MSLTINPTSNNLRNFAAGPAGLSGGAGVGNGNSAGPGAPTGDRFGLSPEAQQAGAAQGNQRVQQLSQQLMQGISKVEQAESSKQDPMPAAQELSKTYKGAGQMINQVAPPLRARAEEILEKYGLNKGQEQGGAGKSGGCGGGGGGGCGKSGGAGEAGGAEEGKEKETDWPEELLKKLEELLGKDKAEEAKESKEGEEGEEKGEKTDTKPGQEKPTSEVADKSESKVDSKGEVKTDTKAKVPAKTSKPAAKKAAPKKLLKKK